MFRFYKDVLHKRPYLIQSVQTASLMVVGDFISQSIVENKSRNQINYVRVIKFGSIGLMLGPTLTKWYRVIDKIGSKTGKGSVLKKIALDQLFFAPIAVASITTLVGLGDGKSGEEIRDKLRKDYTSIMLTNYKVWPFVQLVNFSFVPLDYRVLVTQLVAVLWNTYLSWKLNYKEDV